jgi:hypothetical protein
MMTFTIELPEDLERVLRRDLGNLDLAGKEAMLVELYRQGTLTHHQLAQALGLDRFETEDVLQRHHVTEDLGTLDDYLADANTLQKLRNAGR